MIDVLTKQFQSIYYKGQRSEDLQFNSFDIQLKNEDQLNLLITQQINNNNMLSMDELSISLNKRPTDYDKVITKNLFML